LKMETGQEVVFRADFSRGLEGFVTWCRRPSAFEAFYDRSEPYGGRDGSLRVTYRESRVARRYGMPTSWTIVCKMIDVKPGDEFTVEAAIKPQFRNRKSVAGVFLVSLKTMTPPTHPFMYRRTGASTWRGTVSPWVGGNLIVSGTWPWRRLVSYCVVPEETDKLEINISGIGPGTVYIGELVVRRGRPKGVSLKGEVEPPAVRELPKPVLYKRIKLGDFSSSNLRVGDLNGDGRPELVFAQAEALDVVSHTVVPEAANITCLTALDLDGRVLWQLGEPDPMHYPAWGDWPFQVYDLDGDGKDEVLCAKDFELLLIDGETGEILRRAPTPESKMGEGWGGGDEDWLPRISGDSIMFCDLSGRGRREEFTIKDRYNNMWAYDSQFNLLWSYTGKMAHYPRPYDIDGDGREEIFTGDAMVDHNGRVMWRIDIPDHCDSIIIGEIDSEPGLDILMANSNGGFYILDAQTGDIKREWHLGHCQTVAFGNFLEGAKEPQILGITFWGGRYWFLFDRDLNMKLADFNPSYGVVPVNWDGSGVELLLGRGGLYDAYGRLVVKSPDAPRGGVAVYNVCGDVRDEIIIWDREELHIYTQSEPFRGRRIYAPIRHPDYNRSGYGGHKSEPNWMEIKG